MGFDYSNETRLQAVTDCDDQSILMDYFDECYLKKLKVAYMPHLKAADLTFFKDLKRHVGLSRAKQIIMQFFSLDTFLIKNKGYTVPVLKMELNTVNVALGRKLPQERSTSTLKIKTWVFCDTLGCNKNFETEVEASPQSFSRTFACNECVTRDM